MSRLTELIRQAKDKDPGLGAELEREYRTLSGRRAFGLNFERHRPEAVELPGRPVRRGDKVRILPPRGSIDRGDQRLWRVTRIEKVEGERLAHLEPFDDREREPTRASADDLAVVAEFRDPIHPGLMLTGGVHRGGDKPSQTVINGENFHVLKALTYTHRGRVDAIYIDPPYNTGARDWKYNNDYVESDDLYRHSKWLAFMERRLLLAKELLNPSASALIVAIDEREVHRLGLLLEDLFPGTDRQMVTLVMNRAGSPRPQRLTRVEEYLFFVFLGEVRAGSGRTNLLSEQVDSTTEMPTVWFAALRRGKGKALRSYYKDTELFYPVHIDAATGTYHSVGDPLPSGEGPESYQSPTGTIPIWPVAKGNELTWRFSREKMEQFLAAGTARLGKRDPETGLRPVTYLQPGTVRGIEAGIYRVTGRTAEGALQLAPGDQPRVGKPAATVWNMTSHYARDHGSQLLDRLLPGRGFPFPKALYAVEDAVRIATGHNPDAVVLDFFAGSGTTAHAVMRLNKQDGGTRQCISVTNNEVSADEQKRHREAGMRPGDPDWEALGICDYVTKPRIEAAITGRTPDGDLIKGEYKFIDEFPMADGFDENAEFFTLTYENPVAVGHNRAFERVAPLLWLRAGAQGRRIDTVPEAGWDLTDTYGILFDLDRAVAFAQALEEREGLHLAFVVTDDDRRFQSVARQFPDLEVVRLYESYLSNFRFTGTEP